MDLKEKILTIRSRNYYGGDPWGRPSFVHSGMPVLFDVVLKSPGLAKLKVVQSLHLMYRGLFSLKETKELVDKYPVVIFERLPQGESEKIQNELHKLGATIDIR